MNESCSCKSNTVNEGCQTVFVYGTLKRGGCNHHCMSGSLFMGVAETCGRFALYQGADPWPFLVENEPCYPVQGELYSVTPRELAWLDEFEECPQLYVRKPIAVRTTGADVIETWAYFSVKKVGRRLVTGNWSGP